MSHSLNNHDDNCFYKTQHEEASNSDEHGRKKESITLKLLKTIFEFTLRKMELAVALPSIILNPELSMILTKCEVGMIKDIFLCDTEHCSSCLLKSEFEQKEHSLRKRATTKTHCQTTWTMSRFDRAVYRALQILNKHIDVLHPRDKYISIPSALFLHHLRCFLQHALCRLHLTPDQARSKELHYRQFWRDQKRSIEDSDVFTRDLEKQRRNHEKLLENVIKQYKKNLAVVVDINKKCNEDMANITVKYEKKQLMLHKVWEIEQNEVQRALNSITDDLESLKNINANISCRIEIIGGVDQIRHRNWKQISNVERTQSNL
ncbi:uncharacterized protein LOC109854035 isoform X2 [Pseudomyrmex gracilis]|uniref:uncharacterized protein LOC109854035 isoform X2 n=1 Tax=Pseudomyrmex gracilis TaxID=219809 RepID=UPI000994A156|nr:uncharacterized protein LOC109854035 isoform X2 [Pseudomyrmex gracilis]